MMRIIVIIFFVNLLTMCSAQKGVRYEDATKLEINRYLWKNTNEVWEGSLDERIKELIGRGADVNYISGAASDGQTPFLNVAGILEELDSQNKYTKEQIDAYELEAVKIVKYLAKNGASIHARTSGNNLNALHLAANGGREKMIPVLVKLGLDINSRNGDPDYGGTVLWHAINAGDLATVKAVVEAGADIDLCLLDGNSPLDWAMAYANPKAKEALWLVPYRDQQAIAEYLQSIGAKHGKNQFKGMLYFDESKE